MGLQKRLQCYFYLFNQGFDFIDEIKEVKKEMLELAEVKSRGVILRRKGNRGGRKNAQDIFSRKVLIEVEQW